MPVLSKTAEQVFAGHAANGDAREIDTADAVVWGTEIEAAIEDAIDAVDGGIVRAETWAALSGIAGTRDGQPGEVPDQSGTHVDPVSGATVANRGKYRWVAASSAWRWVSGYLDVENVDTNKILGRISSGTGAMEELSPTDARTVMDVLSANSVGFGTRYGMVVHLANVAGSGDAVTADIPDEVIDVRWNFQIGVAMRVRWPAANATKIPKITVTRNSVSYIITLTGPAGRQMVEGELKAGAYYDFVFVSNSGFNAVGQVINTVSVDDVADSGDMFAGYERPVFAESWRPGDAPEAFTQTVQGLPEDLDPIASYTVPETTDGRVLRLSGAQVLAPRRMWRLDPTRTYRLRAIYRRPQNVGDPAGASVRVFVAWLNAAGVTVETATMALTETPFVSSGRRIMSKVLSASAGDDVDIIWPSTAVYCRAYIQTYQSDSVTDIEEISWADITDVGGYSPDLTSVEARLTALESADLDDRVTDLEAGASGPKRIHIPTRADAISYDVPATVDVIEVSRYAIGKPACAMTFERVTSSTPGGFQNAADSSYWSLVNDPVRLEMFGADGDGTDDTAAYTAAIALGRSIDVTGKEYLVTAPANTLGVPIIGDGVIYTETVGGGIVKANSAFDNCTPVWGRSHLWKVKNLWNAGGNAVVMICGDSTATNAYGTSITNLVKETLQGLGLGVASVTNNAVGGTAWFSTDLAATYLTSATDFLIIKYALNDSGVTPGDHEAALSSMRTVMRTRLSEIRASTHGGYDDLSILLLGPNAAQTDGGKNAVWLELVRRVYIEAARDFQCAYYDPYIEARIAAGGADQWLDSNEVHPKENFSRDIWGRALEETCAAFGSVRRNGFANIAFAEGVAPAPTVSLTSYPLGLSVMRCQAADGWPFVGIVTTMRHPDTTGWQRIDNYNNSYGISKSRTWHNPGAAWTGWSGDVVALTLQNSWVHRGSPFGVPSVRRSPDGQVSLSGVMKDGTATGGTLLFTLPAGYRPTEEKLVTAIRYYSDLTAQDVCLLRIQVSGAVLIERNANTNFLGLDGITFWTSL